MLQLARLNHRCCFFSLTYSCLSESWLQGQCLQLEQQEASGTKETGLFYTNVLSSLLSPPFAKQNLLELCICVSILFSRHLFSSDFLKRPGFPWRQEIPGRWWILKDPCSCGYSTSDMTNDPLMRKSEWKKNILAECSSTCQEVTSAVFWSRGKAGSAAAASNLCHFIHQTMLDPTAFTSNPQEFLTWN